MNNNPSGMLSLEEQLQQIQERLRYAARQRADLIAQKRPQRDIDRFDQDVAILRQQRQSLINALDREKRGTLVTEATPPPNSRAKVKRATGEPPFIIRFFALVLTVFVVSLITISAIGLIITRLQPPPVEDATTSEPADEFAWTDDMDFAERALATYLSFNRGKINSRPSDDSTLVSFVIESGESAGGIAERLAEEGFIVDAEVFRRLLQWRGADSALEAGEYELSRNMTMDEIIAALQLSPRDEIQFTLVEGLRAEQMAEELERQGIALAADYMALVQNPAFFAADYEFLQALPEGSTLEGYLFPDTYRVFADEVTAESVIRLQLDTFALRVTPELRAAAQTQNLTLHQAIIIASIVEREAVLSEERATIAGVYMNRLRDGTLLNADPTIQYALGRQEDGSWWKRPLTAEDLQLDSPYNSYTRPGLPPTPIDSPGLATIEATITAPPTEFYYFVSRNDGSHVFAVTYEEHLQNVAEFQSQ
jgi:UPF0755 protein